MKVADANSAAGGLKVVAAYATTPRTQMGGGAEGSDSVADQAFFAVSIARTVASGTWRAYQSVTNA